MRRDILNILSQFGLKSSEQSVYITCLAHRDGLFAQEIANMSKIKRSSVDLIIQRLLESGFLVKQKIERRHRYLAQSPEAILFKKEQILEDFKTLIPFLNTLHAAQTETDIFFFEGMEGIKRMYQEGMIYLKLCAPKDRMIRAITSGIDLTKIIPDFENFWVKKRIRLKIPVRILAPIDSQTVQTMTPCVEKLRSVKYFNDRNFPYKIGIEIFAGGMVGVFSVSKPLRGIVIKDKIMAQSFTCLFELLWDNIRDGGP